MGGERQMLHLLSKKIMQGPSGQSASPRSLRNHRVSPPGACFRRWEGEEGDWELPARIACICLTAQRQFTLLVLQNTSASDMPTQYRTARAPTALLTPAERPPHFRVSLSG